MNVFKYLVIVSLLSLNCSPEGADDFIREDVEASYKILVTGGVKDFIIEEGTDARWRPDIGHMSLGPEDNGCSVPVASFTMDVDPKVITVDGDSLKIDSSDVQFRFWSILYPCNDLGDQESNLYTSVPESGELAWAIFGIDSRGLQFIKGVLIEIVFTRTLVNAADVPEEIKVSVEFTAVE